MRATRGAMRRGLGLFCCAAIILFATAPSSRAQVAPDQIDGAIDGAIDS